MDTIYMFIPFLLQSDVDCYSGSNPDEEIVEGLNGDYERVKETPIKKVITCIKITCKITNGISVKAIDTSGFIVVRTIYTSHTGQYMPKHAVFECLAVCLHVSVIIELLPGLIPFTSKWHAG